MDNKNDIYVLDQRVRLLQPDNGFRTGLDAVLLASACPAKTGAHIIDLGCGVGAVGLCALYRIPDATLTGIDIQSDHIKLAIQNANLNTLSKRANFINADVRDFEVQNFTDVVCNPPYMDTGTHTQSPAQKRAIALGHNDEDININTWINTAFNCLKGQGSLTMIHRADMVDKIICAMGKRFGAIEIIPLWPKAGRNAKRVIIRAYKHKKSPATIHAGIVLHKENGEYTNAAQSLLKQGRALI